ncbi:MAG TPA: hypothetical protein VH722_17760 [Alphaproteobacteria bacterium]|jgi:hypothetical protein|nr:hypothetical protein [Alphaproteobacteria bacterium]
MLIEPLNRFPKTADDCRGRADTLRKASEVASSSVERILFLRFAEEWEEVAQEFEQAAG